MHGAHDPARTWRPRPTGADCPRSTYALPQVAEPTLLCVPMGPSLCHLVGGGHIPVLTDTWCTEVQESHPARDMMWGCSMAQNCWGPVFPGVCMALPVRQLPCAGPQVPGQSGLQRAARQEALSRLVPLGPHIFHSVQGPDPTGRILLTEGAGASHPQQAPLGVSLGKAPDVQQPLLP